MTVQFTLPQKIIASQLRADQRLYNDVIDCFATMGVGWAPDSLPTAQSFTKALSNALWYLDPHHDTLCERGIKLPVPFDKFQGYNDYKRKKEKRPRLSQEGLNRHVQALSDFLSQPWFTRSRYVELRGKTEQCVESMRKYEQYLRQNAERANQVHHSAQLVRSPAENVILKTIHASSQSINTEYTDIFKRLEEIPEYQPVFLNDFAPKDRYKRRKWLNELQLPLTVTIYMYPHGNNLGTMNFAWKVPDEVDQTLNQQTIAQLNKSQKVYYTRQMRSEFLDTYTHLSSRVSTKSKAVLRNIFRTLVHDESAPTTVAESRIDDRVAKCLLDVDDPDIIIDMRKMNGKPGSSEFNAFWLELNSYIEEVGPAVQERRHGETMYMPVAISVNHLREVISSRLREKSIEASIPSTEWIRLQFWPRNPYASSALRYTGRFDVKFAVQCRQLRREHPDSKYVAVILHYAKEFAVRHSDVTLMISVDDKAIIPVGEPDCPISSGVRGHNRSLVVGSALQQLKALDHDFHLAGVVPSVAFFPNIPKESRDSFYSGSVFVTLKDKVLQPSHALRHSVELSNIVQTHFEKEESTNHVVLVVSDGGPDHRVTYLSVKVAMIALFKSLDLDMLIAIRTCPYQSWSNLAERAMSTLNLALQNVSLARAAMDPEFEGMIRNKCTLTELRAAIDKSPPLAVALRDSMSPVIARLAQRFTQMKLKEEPVLCANAASDEEIDQYFELVHFIEPSLSQDNLTVKALESCSSLKKFLDTHCNSSHYVFQIRKCLDPSCYYCVQHPVRMDLEKFKELSLLPLPLLDTTKEHYRPFEELNGSEPTEKDRPSLQQSGDPEAVEADTKHKLLFNSSKVRAILNCQECFKPRCVYSARKLSLNEKVLLDVVVEDKTYTCGAAVFPPSSPLADTVVVRQNIGCPNPMEAQYYSATLVSFPPVCYFCAVGEECLVEDDSIRELRKEYAVVRPICFLCKAEGKTPYVRMPSNVRKRPRLS